VLRAHGADWLAGTRRPMGKEKRDLWLVRFGGVWRGGILMGEVGVLVDVARGPPRRPSATVALV
jgi:hypothetical protein